MRFFLLFFIHFLAADETYAVCLREDNVAIGSIGLITPAQSHTKAADDEIEIGYWIGVPYWGQRREVLQKSGKAGRIRSPG